MKKFALALISCSLLLAGCGSATTNLQNKNDVIMTIGDTTITLGDEYECDKLSNGSTMVMEIVKKKVYDKNVEITDEIKEEANKQYEELLTYYTDLESQLISLGYKDKDDYINRVLMGSAQSTALTKKYFEDNKEEIRTTYKPSVAKILECDDEETAKKALQALKDGTDPEEVYNTYKSADATYTNADTVITTNLTLPTRLINTLYEAEKTGVIDEVFKFDGEEEVNYLYSYVAILVDNDYDKILSQVMDSIIASDTEINDKALLYYLKKYDFKIHDQDIFDYMKVNTPKYLVSHPELAETETE
ncbi:MAG: hypothetical protein HUJ53_09455 [Holdemanella sp.]|nr:hypothetical protein [Holdemanella sp.]